MGENSIIFIENIFTKLKINNLPKNIVIENSKISNLKILQNSRRIVTYSGTVALESCVYGIKPITIATTSVSSYSNDLS